MHDRVLVSMYIQGTPIPSDSHMHLNMNLQDSITITCLACSSTFQDMLQDGGKLGFT